MKKVVNNLTNHFIYSLIDNIYVDLINCRYIEKYEFRFYAIVDNKEQTESIFNILDKKF